ncbi:MAG TPA: PQQ-dependent dehydrogenase, methanol/ethanol family [Verrucomicrobiae bacterium]|nr:PQQ-dependent dehydrogenase, methanol/ethanol family [Verrucomicrobiae bacterium]
MRTIRYAAIALALLVPAASLAQSPVPYERIVKSDSEPANWLTYGGNYFDQRFSGLKQLTPENVGGLKLAWAYQPSRPAGNVETSPIVVDGIMYVTEPPSTVTALDARSGARLWTWSPVLKNVVAIGLFQTNRGVAVMDDTVYVATIDAHLVALDAKSGAVRWNTVVADNKLGYAITGPPLAFHGRVMIGTGGSEAAVRGLLDCYDAKTGKRLWRIWTVPLQGEPGSETWGTSVPAGGTTWNAGAYDPKLNLVYWGTGNPAPDWNGDDRPGSNLYTCALLAIDPDSGTIKWYFQFSPHETHDWDASEPPILFDQAVGGKPRKLLGFANRNGFYYVLDRATGEFVAGMPYVKQTWAKGLDAKGQPIVIPDTGPSPEGNLVFPSITGAINWTSNSYSPVTRLFYVDAREMGSYFVKGPNTHWEMGKFPMGAGGERALSGDDAYGAIRALDATTGKMKWEFRLHSPSWVGTLATAGGLVFSGTDEGNFFALDAVTGKPLWDIYLGSSLRSNPVTYSAGGKQYVFVTAGTTYFTFSLP